MYVIKIVIVIIGNVKIIRVINVSKSVFFSFEMAAKQKLFHKIIVDDLTWHSVFVPDAAIPKPAAGNHAFNEKSDLVK